METTDILEEIRGMDLGELGEVARVALSTIYNRLRDEKGFGYDTHFSLVSVGCDEYSVKIVALDGTELSGENYVNAYII